MFFNVNFALLHSKHQKGLERHIKNIHEIDVNYNPKNEPGIKRKIENTNGNITEKTSNKKNKQLILISVSCALLVLRRKKHMTDT